MSFVLPIADFDRFGPMVALLPLKAEGEKYERTELIRPCFHLFSDSGLDAYYAPFHYLNVKARVVLMGLTPGWTQMEQAFRAARIALSCGLEGDALFQQVEATASFSGPMRKNLVEMLDGIGLNRHLGIESCLELFGAHNELVHFTSAVSAPVFRNGQNYRGYGPPMLQVPTLARWLLENLAHEIASVPEAVIVPLGRVADEAVEFLSERGLFDLSRCLTGFPHPSGANGHRKPDFERGRERWSVQISTWFDGAR